MYPAVIQDYRRPKSVQEAVKVIADGGADAVFIAGGQSLMQAVKVRLVQPHALIDLQDVAELKGVRFDGDVRIGAMTRYVDLAAETRLAPAYAALIDAAPHVGDRQVRNRGTIGGSLCWNYIAACMPAVVLTLDATMNLVSGSGGERSLRAHEFIGAPLETARKDDELLVSLELPASPASAGSAYPKWSLVSDGLPVIGACVYVELDGWKLLAGAGRFRWPREWSQALSGSGGAAGRVQGRRRSGRFPGHGGGGAGARDAGRPLGRPGLPLASHPDPGRQRWRPPRCFARPANPQPPELEEFAS